jgi:hypothetical protein
MTPVFSLVVPGLATEDPYYFNGNNLINSPRCKLGVTLRNYFFSIYIESIYRIIFMKPRQRSEEWKQKNREASRKYSAEKRRKQKEANEALKYQKYLEWKKEVEAQRDQREFFCVFASHISHIEPNVLPNVELDDDPEEPSTEPPLEEPLVIILDVREAPDLPEVNIPQEGEEPSNKRSLPSPVLGNQKKTMLEQRQKGTVIILFLFTDRKITSWKIFDEVWKRSTLR